MSKGVKKKGFTLVELVVVLAIFGLLASITGLGLYSWTRYSINKENNENARTIFLAAQESLTHMQASGTLDTLNFSNVDNTDVQGIINNNPELEPTLSTYGNRLKTFYYVPTNKSGLVYYLLKPYLEGTGIFDGSIAIEMDPVDGVVYSVFYSKKATSFYYETRQDLNESGQVGICKRDSGTLKDRLLGFYSTNLTLPKPTQLPVAYIESNEPLSAKTQLINAEELYYIISFDDLGINNKSELLSPDTSFEIDIYDPNVSVPMIKIKTTGTKLNSINNGLVSYTISYKKSDNNGGGAGQYPTQIEMNLRTEISDNYIKVVFDSIDVNTVNKLSSSNIAFSYDGSKINGFKNYDDSFSNTYSIFNLLRGLKEKNSEIRTAGFDSFYCKYIINVGGKEKKPTQPSNTENYLFKSFKENDNNSIYIEISNIRHLFNICYIEKINNTTNRYTITYKQVNSFDYYGDYIFSSINGYASPTKAGGFPTIKYFGSKSTYDASENSNSNYSINNLVLNSKVLDSYTDESKNSIYKYNLGIFAENYGTIKNLELNGASLINYKPEADNSNVDNSNNKTNGSGIITAVNMNNGIIENCKVSGSITGEVNIGGIAGINSGSIYDVFVKVTVEATGENGGGFAGINNAKIQNNKNGTSEIIVRGNNKIGGISGTNNGEIYNLYFSGEIIAEGDNVGGITGVNNNKVQIDGTKTINVSVTGRHNVGGIVGENNKEIYDLSVNATVKGTGDNAGGIAGINKGKIQLKEQYKNVINVSGVNNVGGIVGDNNNEIYDLSVNATVKGTGDNVGGIAGINKGKIQLKEQYKNVINVSGVNNVGGIVGHNSVIDEHNIGMVSNALVGGSVVASKDCVGGVVGKNDGTVSEIAVSEIAVKGRDCVGGYVGKNNNNISNISDISNIQITGNNVVGGLFGYTKISNWICENISLDNITVTGKDFVGGFAGQIVSNNNINQIYCKVNNSSIHGVNYVSGIYGQLTKYDVDSISIKGEVKNTNISGSNYVAGVLPLVEKNVYISNVTLLDNVNITILDNVNITISNNKNNIYCGLVSAVNNGEIFNTTITNSTINGTSDSYIGGIAGINYGKIESSKVVQSVIKYGDLSSAGFISGINEGIIQDSGVYSNSYIPKENTTFSTVYLGDITGINGSLSVLDGNKMAKISNCKSVNLISEGNQREIGIAGINLAKIEKTSLFNDSDQNLVDTAWNSYGKRSELTINEPVRNENGDLTISFSGYNSNVSNFKLIISVLYIEDGNIESNNVYSAESGDVTCDSQNQSCTYNLSFDKVEKNNGFVVYVENLDDRTESSINNLSSISASSYYYDMPLSTVDFEVTNENNLFKITYTPLNGDIANYIDKYQLKYQIDDSSVNIVDFTDSYLKLNSITGNNVKFAVIAVPKSEYVFYAKSKTVWKTYLIANISSIENNIAEVNDNIEVSENQNIGVENE